MNVPSQLSEDQVRELDAARRSGVSSKALGAKYSLNPNTLRDWFTKRGVTTGSGPSIVPAPMDVGEQVRHDRQLEAAKAQAKHYRRLYHTAIRDSSAQDMLVDVMREAVTALPVLTPHSISVPRDKAKGMHTALAFLSDLHNGEVVSSESMGDLGQYNMEIFRQRVGLWTEKLLHLVNLRRGRLEIPRLTIFEDGDLVSGLIHDELVRTNQVNVMEQATVTAMLLSHAIAQLSQHFEEIHISCTVGNHGRNQQKKEYKETHVSWDYICYQLQAMYLKDYENITFDIPKSLWAITKVENTNWLHFHGHGIQGWNGIPFYGISRAVKALREVLAVDERSFDSVAMGHFHVPWTCQMPTGLLVVNGNWKGGDEFSLNGLHTITRPTQLLSIVHDKYGTLGIEPIFLDHNRPEHADNLPDHLSDVWADQEVVGA